MMRDETRAERRERIATAVFAATANDQTCTWEDGADSAIEAANALIELLDEAAEADTKGEVTK
jgi:hypothetical protein